MPSCSSTPEATAMGYDWRAEQKLLVDDCALAYPWLSDGEVDQMLKHCGVFATTGNRTAALSVQLQYQEEHSSINKLRGAEHKELLLAVSVEAAYVWRDALQP